MEYYEKKGVSPTKKILNICSYVLNAILIIYLIVSLSKTPSVDRNSAEFKEQVAAVIIEKESTELPLRAQEFGVDKIAIDSLVFTDENKGYFVCSVDKTEDYYIGESKTKRTTMYVEVEFKANRKGVRWAANWQKAFLTSLLK